MPRGCSSDQPRVMVGLSGWSALSGVFFLFLTLFGKPSWEWALVNKGHRVIIRIKDIGRNQRGFNKGGSPDEALFPTSASEKLLMLFRQLPSQSANNSICFPKAAHRHPATPRKDSAYSLRKKMSDFQTGAGIRRRLKSTLESMSLLVSVQSNVRGTFLGHGLGWSGNRS